MTLVIMLVFAAQAILVMSSAAGSPSSPGTTLRPHGIAVTALHSQKHDEQQRLFFMHFWVNNDAIKLANGLRAALDETASTKS
jgi:hypothetical protein